MTTATSAPAAPASTLRPIEELEFDQWSGPFSPELVQCAATALEDGKVLFLPHLRFTLTPEEGQFLSPSIVGKSKNVSYNPADGSVRGATCEGEAAERLRALIARFSAQTKALLQGLLPDYHRGLLQARASLRPVEVEGRKTSWRKDDTRLHVDSFPANPTRGRRIIRVFSNVNPHGRPRVWRVGEPFPDLAHRFRAALRPSFPGSATMLQLLRITKGRRTEYDHLMLQLHDMMKADLRYQETVPQTVQEWPAGSTWICFADSVSHAAMSGQHQFEQTFLLAVDSMQDQAKSPLRVLERVTGRTLI